jgi:hypothetical protein
MMPAYVARAAVNLQAGRLSSRSRTTRTRMWVLPHGRRTSSRATGSCVGSWERRPREIPGDLITGGGDEPEERLDRGAAGARPAPVRRARNQYIVDEPETRRARYPHPRGALVDETGRRAKRARAGSFARAVPARPRRLRPRSTPSRQGLAPPSRRLLAPTASSPRADHRPGRARELGAGPGRASRTCSRAARALVQLVDPELHAVQVPAAPQGTRWTCPPSNVALLRLRPRIRCFPL